MSAAGAIFDAVAAAAVSAVASLQAGNVERGIRPRAEVPDDAFPHAFLTATGSAPLRTVELLEDLQLRTTTSLSLLYWTFDASQEQTLVDGDAISAAIAADPTLGGLVRWSFVAEVTLEEHAKEPIRGLELVIVAIEEA